MRKIDKLYKIIKPETKLKLIELFRCPNCNTEYNEPIKICEIYGCEFENKMKGSE